jgi:hypothetical protein
LLVTKLGCKGSKGDIHFINVHPADSDLIPDTFEYIAWTFEKDGIAVEKVKFYFHQDTVETVIATNDNNTGDEQEDDSHDCLMQLKDNLWDMTSNLAFLALPTAAPKHQKAKLWQRLQTSSMNSKYTILMAKPLHL